MLHNTLVETKTKAEADEERLNAELRLTERISQINDNT